MSDGKSLADISWDELGELQRALAEARSRAETLERERDEARDWVRRLHAETQVLTCVFCGESYPPGTAASGEPALLAHVEKCPKHPLAAARRSLDTSAAEVSRLRAVLKELSASPLRAIRLRLLARRALATPASPQPAAPAPKEKP